MFHFLKPKLKEVYLGRGKQTKKDVQEHVKEILGVRIDISNWKHF
jgi:Holliday junction resolvasome RuvABC endonuclease subunit